VPFVKGLIVAPKSKAIRTGTVLRTPA